MKICKNCGKELDGENFCPACGQNVEAITSHAVDEGVKNMVCPHCGSRRLQLVTETNVQTKGKNYSGAQGCLGYLMFGPLGILCGSCGQSQKTNTTQNQYWVCQECGNKFQKPDEIQQDIKKLEMVTSLPFVIFLTLATVFFLVLGISMEIFFFTFLGIMCGAIIGILYPLSKFVLLPKEMDKLRALEEAMDKYR